MRAIRIEATGGADQLRWEDIPVPEPKSGEIRFRVEAAGVNFIDIYQRTGLYPVPLPATPGSEAAGTVTALGAGVTGFKVGDRVATARATGGYAEEATASAEHVVPVPAGVDVKVAGAVMLQGMTAHYLACSTFELKAGDTALIHAAAGGVGLLLIQIAKFRGARVLGTVGTAEKAQIARTAGADEVVLYGQDDFSAAAHRFSGGPGVHVVYDSVGKDTFERSLASLRPRGMMVSFGNSSGPVPPFAPLLLAKGGSLYITRPTLTHYTLTREELLQRSTDLFNWILAGKLKVTIGREFPLAQAAEAHRALESRQTTGKVILIPPHGR
jgi:NADPH2:quinone reductase